MTSTDDIVIVAARTPQGRLKGQLASFTAPQLGGLAIAGARQGNIPADAVDAVIMGQVLPAGSGQNPARQAALAGGSDGTSRHRRSTRCACRASPPSSTRSA
jgi:acetyl-CoA C-acetyltransferase